MILGNTGQAWPQVVAIFASCLSAVGNGMIYSWTSPFILVLTKDKVNYDIREDEAYLLTVVPVIGMVISNVVGAYLMNTLGRKLTLLLIGVPQIMYWVITMFARDIYAFGAARLLFGLSDGMLFAVLPIYIGEICTPKIRGTWGASITFFLFLGQLIINVIGSYLTVRLAAYICIVLPISFLILFWFMPETPYYYLIKGDTKTAEKSLQMLRGTEDITQELQQIKADVERQISESSRWRDLILIPTNRKALLSGIFLVGTQQLGGVNVFVTYTQFIFEKSGGSVSPQTSSIIFMALFTVASVLSGFTVDWLGRRKSFAISAFFCGVLLLIEAVYFYVDIFQASLDVSFLKWLPLTGMVLWVISFIVGLGPVPVLMMGELFSASIKAKGVCAMNLTFDLCMCVTNYFFYVLDEAVGLYCPFLFFAVCCFIAGTFASYFIPETKGKTLEEIQMDLRNKDNQSEDVEKSKGNNAIDTAQ